MSKPNKSNDKNYKYIAYRRKSEEREERQQLSHPAQFDKIMSRFGELDYLDNEKYVESKSAFKPYIRPVFNEMLERVEQGDAQGIVAYHPNRLARNEIDAARITYMLRTGVLKDLKFFAYDFQNNAEGIWMLQQILSTSQYESAKQSREVSRGMYQKVKDNGERPGRVAPGYMKVPIKDQHGNLLRDKDGDFVTETVADPERIHLVSRMWRLLLSGTHTAPQIRKIANEEWKFTLRPTPETGGKPMGLSTIYRIFSNPFYAGYIRHNGEQLKGQHDPIISLAEFDYAQQLLGKKGKPRLTANEYSYTGLIRCGVCGCRVAGKTNRKYVKREGRTVTYVHFHCIRRSEQRPCDQTIYTSLEKLENDIAAELQKYQILPEFRDLALEILKRENALEVDDRSHIYKTQQRRRTEIQKDLDKLLDMRLREQLDEEEYLAKKDMLKKEMTIIDDELRRTETRADDWMELTEKAFNFALYAPAHFRATDDLQVKRDILMTLGANFTLKDQKLTLEPHKWLQCIGDDYPKLEAEFLNVRTEQMALPGDFETISKRWRAIWGSNPGHAA